MITDERDLARSLRTMDSPPGLSLDPDQVLDHAHRTRRHRAQKRVLGAGSVAAVAATALWASGSTLGPLSLVPAAPWTDGCQGFSTGPSGTSLHLEHTSYAELTLPESTPGTAVVAFDSCAGEEGRFGYATRAADGQLGRVESSMEASAATLQSLREGATLMPQEQITTQGAVLYGVVASDAADLHLLSSAGALEVQREPLAGTGLDAYLSPEFTDPEQDTLGMTWQDGTAVNVEWLQVLDSANFEEPAGTTEPLIAQGRDGLWRIWFGQEQANLEGDLGSWLSTEFQEGEGREVVAYLPDGATLEVTEPGGADSAQIRYANPQVSDGRFAWVSAPAGAVVAWVGSDGTREVLEPGDN